MDSDDEETVSKQVFNMVLENGMIRGTVTGWIVFNIIILALLIYISVRISMPR